MIGKNFFFIIIMVSFLTAGLLLTPINAKADEPVVIVIDPGHGGENQGARYDGYTEKELTMTVALAMKEELEKYDNVAVYLTREGDRDMTIRDRAAFAGEKDADFLFCLHFNSSGDHSLFGSEVWVSAMGEYYAKGYSFARIQLDELAELGIYPRGIKTRLNGQGDNYYGILRYCTNEGVPSALIEHCHMDNEKDKKFYQRGEESLKELGRRDAAAAAKYFRLSSEILGVDYSDYPVPETEIPGGVVRPDSSPPEFCRIEVTQIDEETGEATVQMEAEDSDSFILYYTYSFDGGKSYFPQEEWPRPEAWNKSSKSHSFQVTIPLDEEVRLLAAASNGFDQWTLSDVISLGPLKGAESAQEEGEETEPLPEDESPEPGNLPNMFEGAPEESGEESGKEPGEASGENSVEDLGVESREEPAKEASGVLTENRPKQTAEGKPEGTPAGEQEGKPAGEQEKDAEKADAAGVVYVLAVIAGIVGCIFLVSFLMAKTICSLTAGSKRQ